MPFHTNVKPQVTTSATLVVVVVARMIDLVPVAEAIEERADAGRALEDNSPLAEKPIRSNADRRLHISRGDDLRARA